MGKKIKVRDPIAPRSEMVKQMLITTKGGAHRDRRERRIRKIEIGIANS